MEKISLFWLYPRVIQLNRSYFDDLTRRKVRGPLLSQKNTPPFATPCTFAHNSIYIYRRRNKGINKQHERRHSNKNVPEHFNMQCKSNVEERSTNSTFIFGYKWINTFEARNWFRFDLNCVSNTLSYWALYWTVGDICGVCNMHVICMSIKARIYYTIQSKFVSAFFPFSPSVCVCVCVCCLSCVAYAFSCRFSTGIFCWCMSVS